MKILNVRHELLHDKDRVTVDIDLSDRREVSEKFDCFKVQEGKEYDFDLKRHYEKRSLNANSYFHTLVSKLASKLGKTFAETKNEELRRYGQITLDDNGNVVYWLLNLKKDWDQYDDLHLLPTGHTENRSGILYTWCKVVRGSHTYNSREFAVLLDGVIQDAKEQGIETLTPNEVAHLKGLEDG